MKLGRSNYNPSLDVDCFKGSAVYKGYEQGKTRQLDYDQKQVDELVKEILREVESMDKRHTVGFVLQALKQKYGVR